MFFREAMKNSRDNPEARNRAKKNWLQHRELIIRERTRYMERCIDATREPDKCMSLAVGLFLFLFMTNFLRRRDIH